MTSVEEATIIAACREDAATHKRHCTLAASPSDHIKSNMVPQRLWFPRSKHLIHHFDDGQGMTYVVSELINLVDTPTDLDERIVDAIIWLSMVPAPPGHLLGPLGGGCIRHSFFGLDAEAPKPYLSVQALERYIEKGRRRLYRGEGFERVTLGDEKLICTQSRVEPSHFCVDEHGKTVIMGFGNISYLPESFARYSLLGKSFSSVSETLGWAGAGNMDTMIEISINLKMMADPSLGLDANGNPSRKKE